MAGKAPSDRLELSGWEDSALMTLFVFEILCILLYGAASALGERFAASIAICRFSRLRPEKMLT